jgi:acetamidase/formamidase
MRWALLFPIALVCAAETHTIAAERFYNSFHHRHPVLLKIRPGDTVVTKTIDAWGHDHAGKRVGASPNPLTGPFYVEDAAPGDAIVVRFDRIRMNRATGWSGYRLLLSALNPNSIEGLYPNRYKADLVHEGLASRVPWDLDLKANTVRVREPVSKALKLEFPARPMLGCVGVAAAGDFGPSSAISGPYGGNMDYNEVVEGARVTLPVFHPGALLFIGDGHALQADGEPTGTGVETSMDVTFTVRLVKNARLSTPRLENNEWIISIGSQPEFQSPLDRALQLATSDMAEWLTQGYGVEPWAAHLLVGYQGRYDIVTVMGTVALRIPKRALPAHR